MPDQFAAADPSDPTADATAAHTDGRTLDADPAAQLHVTAVIVAHDGHPWLPTLLTALDGATRRPDHVVAVDTGSADATRADLVAALGESDVVVAARTTGFGTAVAQALDNVPREERPAADAWVWLLHDDCAPAPGALEAMLAQAAREPDVAILGPKIRAWPNSRRLTEVGLTLARSGRRERGVDPAERDQGQRDFVHDVLAVNTAGMLIRRDVYDALTGFDPRIVLYGDDIDLCWRAARLGYRTAVCPAAVLYHADAASEQLRPVHASPHPRRQLSRANSLYVLLVNSSTARLPFRYARLVLASVVRILGLLIGKAPTAAWQELRALVDVVVHPRRLLAGRRARARTSSGRPSVPVGPLLARPTTQLRRLVAAVVDLAATAGTEGSAIAGGGRHRTPTTAGAAGAAGAPSGLGGDEDEILDAGSDSPAWTQRLRQPFVVTMLLLLVVTAIATRDLWSTQLSGGALWPAPEHAGDLWSRYVEAWHGVELGSAQTSPPWLAVMAILSTILGGQPWLAVAVVLLGAVPLSGATAYLAARSQIEQPWLRAWTAGTYGLLAAATGAVAQGRLGTCLVLILAPVMLLATRRALVGGASVRGSWPAVFAAALLLAVCGSFVPVAWLVFLVVGLLGAVLTRSVRWLVRVLVIAASAAALTLPWLLTLFGAGSGQGWRALFAEPGFSWTGAAGTAGSSSPSDGSAAHLLTWWLHPLGVGSVPLYGVALLLLAALVALARTDRARATFTAWLLVAIAGGTAVAGASVALVAPTGALSAAWPGTAVALLLAGLIAAGAIGASGADDLLRARTFSWRQPVALVLVIATGLVPVAAAGWWIVRGAADPVLAQPRAVVPAYIAAAQQTEGGARTLVLRPAGPSSAGASAASGQPAGQAAGESAGQVDIGSYQLLRDDAATFADVAVAPGPQDAALVDAALRDVLVDQDQAATDKLARLGVKYVYVTVAASPVAELMDAAPGLVRASAPDGAGVWMLEQPVGSMRVVGTGATTVLAADAGDDDVTLTLAPGLADAGGTDTTATSGGSGSVVSAPGASGRRLELAEAADPRWRATLDGVPLSLIAADTQTFRLPDSGGTLHVWFDDPAHRNWQIVQLVILAGVVLLAFPGIGRRTELAARGPQGMGR